MKPLRVLSLFDGIGGCHAALDKAGIPVQSYFASEIEKDAVQISTNNYPHIDQVGDVTKLFGAHHLGVDLLAGGSPCQSVSRAVSNRANLEGKSKLFWEYARIFHQIKPKWFLLENVVMDKAAEDIISEELGVAPVKIDSAHFSPQTRERLYWTNIPIPDTLPPRDTRVLGDILEPAATVPDKYWYPQEYTLTGKDGPVIANLHINGHDFLKRVLSPDHKSHTLTAVCGGNQQKKVLQDGRVRKLIPVEYERLAGLPNNFTAGVSDTARWKAIGNGWQVDTVAWLFSGLLGLD